MRVKFGLSEGGGKSGGYTTSEATIVRIRKGVGSRVLRGDIIADVETNKTGFEIEAPVSGTIVQLFFSEDESWNKTGEEKMGADMLYLPALGEIETEGCEVSEKSIGHPEDENKASLPVQTHSSCGAEPQIGASHRANRRDATGECIPRAVPAARVAVRDAGVSLSSVVGTGPDGIIQASDVGGTHASRSVADDDPIVITPSRFHREMARRVALSKQSIPHAGDKAVHADATVLWRYMNKLKLEDLWFRSRGFGPRLEHFIGYFAVELLRRKEFQVLNGYWDDKTERIIVMPHVNIGFAVDATDLSKWGDDRLGIPIVRRAEAMDFMRFTESVEAAIARARERKLTSEDDLDLTFTVNNTGVLGGVAPDSVIPITKDKNGNDRPTGLILNIGAVEGGDGMKTMSFSFRFDHRLSAGRRVMQFAAALSERVASFDPYGFLKAL